MPEFFLAFTAITIITHCSIVAYNKKYKNALLQFSVTSLSILIVLLTLILYFHEGSVGIKYFSLEFAFMADSLGYFSKIFTMTASLLCMYLLQDYIIEYKVNNTEYDLLMLYAILGLTMLISANDFATIFLALELQSLSLYMLSGFKKNSIYSIESGLKYFIVGALSAAYFLLGWSLLYGTSGLFILLNFHFFFFNMFSKISMEKDTIQYKTINQENFMIPLNIFKFDNYEITLILHIYNNISMLLNWTVNILCCDNCHNKVSVTTIKTEENFSVTDEILKLYDSEKSKISHAEYTSITCEFCREFIKAFKTIDAVDFVAKERLRLYTEKEEYDHKNQIPENDRSNKKRCWFCEKVIKNYKKEIENEERIMRINQKKMLSLYKQWLEADVFEYYRKYLENQISKRTELTPKVHKDSIIKGVFETCDTADDEEYSIPVCKHVIKRFKKAWEIEGLRSSILTKNIEKSCERIKHNSKTDHEICQAIKKFTLDARQSTFSNNQMAKPFTLESLFLPSKVNLLLKDTNNIIIKTKSNESLVDELKLAESSLTLILISFFFKLAVAPFHLWSLDIYEGSPTSSTIFFAIVTKFSVVIMLMKICYYGFYSLLKSSLYQSIIIASTLSILIGSIAGLTERKLKSLLAYSSINNIGYVLLALTIGTLNGVKTTLFYLIIYLSSSLATWSGLLSIQLKKNRYIKKQNKEFADIIMLKKANPILTITLQIALFSTAGLPPFIGFLTKMNVFLTSIESHIYLVSLVTILLSIISTFYYLRLIKITCFEKLLVGKLYKPMKLKQSRVNTIFSFLLPYQFVKPWFSIFFSYKIIIC
jgi:NADH:ubiquinone oxidoreductase subunit 2 (subunit N)